MQIQTCFSPSQYPLFETDNTIVVITDILRATSAMCTGFEYGIKKIIPVATVTEAQEYKDKGFIVAAERDGKIVDGFTLGNSPFDYMQEFLIGQTVVISTTNGTQAIEAARDAYKVVLGAFVNITAIANFLNSENANVIILCAGWKNKFNLEDTLFAGALSQKLIDSTLFNTDCDSTYAAMHLYDTAKDNMFSFLEKSSHRNRLKNLNLEKDINYCLTPDSCAAVPVLVNNTIINMAANTVTQ